MGLGKLIKSAARVVKNNPEIALVFAGVVAPKLVRKAAPLIVKAKVVRDLVEDRPSAPDWIKR